MCGDIQHVKHKSRHFFSCIFWGITYRMLYTILFTGPVAWTKKKTETELNATEGNRILSCSCFILELIRLLVTIFCKYLKTIQRPVFKLYIHSWQWQNNCVGCYRPSGISSCVHVTRKYIQYCSSWTWKWCHAHCVSSNSEKYVIVDSKISLLSDENTFSK